MNRYKLLSFALLSRLTNSSFRTFFNRVISLGVLALLIYRFLILINVEVTGYWAIIFPFIIILSLSVKRISNNFLFSRITKHASMIIKDTTRYREIDYINKKQELSNLLKKEFIEGLINASKISKKVRFSTHKWFVENVVLSKEIKDVYDIEILEDGKISLSLEVLTLIRWSEIVKLNPEIINSVLKKRKGYKVKLSKIKK